MNRNNSTRTCQLSPPLYFFSIKIVQSKNLPTLYNVTLSSLFISRTLYIFEKCTEFKKCTELRVSLEMLQAHIITHVLHCLTQSVDSIQFYQKKTVTQANTLFDLMPDFEEFFRFLLKCRSLIIFYSMRSLTCSFHKKRRKSPIELTRYPFSTLL